MLTMTQFSKGKNKTAFSILWIFPEVIPLEFAICLILPSRRFSVPFILVVNRSRKETDY